MIKNHLKEWRARQAQRGISKATLARRIHVNRSYVTKLEQGKAVPSLQVALQLAEYFGCTVDDLFELQTETTIEFCRTDMLPNGHSHEN
ncbi:MAG TPA: helix-turn-helix transcriptional regulator [Nitrospira sp.]|jgi:putative transcriptional regulator|nr:helix-turn-helix transcriptional regulator [Nitrospira sp.]